MRKIGKMVHFGKDFQSSCNNLLIGDGCFIADRVIIEGDIFEIGKNGFIGFEAYLDGGHDIYCGDNVCIGPRAMIYTHAHWNNVLDGYYCKHEKVVVENDVWIGARVIVLPGVAIGEGSVITVNSVVMNDIPAHCLATGNPAKVVISNYPKKPSKNKRKEIINEIYLGILDIFMNKELNDYDLYVKDDFITINHPKKESVVFDLAGKKIIGKQDKITDEVREYLRKRGIKFEGLWRYNPSKKD